MKKKLLFVTIFVCANWIGDAQSNLSIDLKTQEALKELHATIIQYVQTNILPEARAWKSQLDAAMTEEDLQSLNVLRSKAAFFTKERIDYQHSMRDAWTSEDYVELKEVREKMESIRADQIKLAGELKPIAMKYRSTLESIGEIARPKIQGWKEDCKKKYEQWYTKYKDDLSISDEQIKKWKVLGEIKKMGFLGEEMKKKVAVARFMLWNGDDFTQDRFGADGQNKLSSEKETSPGANDLILEQNYPNPFGSATLSGNPTTTIRFSLPSIQKIALVIRDMNGKEVASVFNGELNSGQHSFVFEAKNLPSGTYYVELLSPTSAQVKAMNLVK